MLTQRLQDYILVNDTHDIFTLWDANKAYVRGILIQLGRQAKHAQSAKLQHALTDLQESEHLNNSNPDSSKASTLVKLHLELRSLTEKHNFFSLPY